MKVVFLGGSRAITRLSPEVRQRIDEFVNEGLPILVGDANGADKAFQRYLAVRSHPAVTVFCAGDGCRNNLANWPAKRVVADKGSKGFKFYEAKDRAMAREATVALMIWDGRSLGTALNVLRMLKQGKEVELYEPSAKQHWALWNERDWVRLLATWDARFAHKLKERAAQEPALVPPALQGNLPLESRSPDSSENRTV